MEKYFVLSTRLDYSDFISECLVISENEFPSIGLAYSKFFTLVGQYSSDFSRSSVENYDTSDSPYLKKVRVKSGNVSIYVYLQKLS